MAEPPKKIAGIYIKCGHCGTTFPSPIGMSDTRTMDMSTLIGNTVQCPTPNCREAVYCNKENMSVRYEGGQGGFVGEDFPGNKGP